MQISQHLKESSILLNFSLEIPEDDEKWTLKKTRDLVFHELVNRFETIGNIGNKTKLFNEFIEREKKDSCCIGEQIALPHLRTLQCKDLMISIITSQEGIDFGAFDAQPVKVFFAFIAPPYDDNLYRILYKNLTTLFENEDSINTLLSIEKPGEMIRFLKQELP